MNTIPILEMENITKVYGNGFVANKDVNFTLYEGEIHALAGENGAGKSTLMKMIFGEEQPDFGKIKLSGKEVKISGPMEAIRLGIGMVHQHFMLVPSLTVTENMVMGMEPLKGAFIDFNKANELCKITADKYNFDIDLHAKVESLPVGIKQKVEILKALIRGAKILILDEPTAVLTPQETQELFVQLKKLKESGHTIIFISHKLKEIKEICDRITILRHGKTMGSYEVKDLSEQDISRLMVGRDVILKLEKKAAKPGKNILALRNLSVYAKDGAKKLHSVSLDIREGEILGVAGIEGNGQREMAEAITGLNTDYEGDILLEGINLKHTSVRKIREAGLSHIPEDRMTYGVIADASVEENMISDRFYKNTHSKNGILRKKDIQKESDTLIKEYLVKCDDREQAVRMLSGGNIQKVVVARECSGNAKMIVVNQPTRGIDVGAIEFVRKRLVELRDAGVAQLLFSADLNEILELSDSLIVLCEGEIVAYFNDASQVSETELGEYMLGIKRMSKEEIGGIVHEI